ncbi:hypothetical protein B0H11DRAFT_2248172 [Mycena galericulata]|nr:hypothetical protein B0H11DRAFT_2248172 [Mycena galericulata]
MPPTLSRKSTLLLTSSRRRNYSPAQIYRWMKLNEQDASSKDVFLTGYLSIHDVGRDDVLCEIERVDSTDMPSTETRSFTLYVTATVSDHLLVADDLRVSPRAILDTFTGNCGDPSAPDWIRRPDPTLRFRQPRDTFIGLFTGMALWDENLLTPNLSSSMIIWAEGISIGTWAESKNLGPTTPAKQSTLPLNTKARKQRAGCTREFWERRRSGDANTLDLSPTMVHLKKVPRNEPPSISSFLATYTAAVLAFSAYAVSAVAVQVQWPGMVSYHALASSAMADLSFRTSASDMRLVNYGKAVLTRSVGEQPANHPVLRVEQAALEAERSQAPSGSGGPPAHSLDESGTHCEIPPPVSAPSPFTVEAEALGLAHAQRVEASAEVFIPISDDNWEDAPEDGGPEIAPTHSLDVPVLQQAQEFDENNPDPFQYTPKPSKPLPTASDVHPNRAVYLIYLVVFWLHAQFHLPFRACSALLSVIALAFQAANAPISPAIHTTLPSVINQLDAEPTFQILPRSFDVVVLPRKTLAPISNSL